MQTLPTRPLFRFDVISIFPEFFEPWSTLGVCGRAVDRNLVSLRLWNPRQFVNDPHQTIDDRPYGGGPGMVMMAAPLADAVKAIRDDLLAQGLAAGPVVMLSPSGRRMDQAWLEEKLARPGPQDNAHYLAEPTAQPVAETFGQPHAAPITQQMTLVCGRYEGVDQRFINNYVTEELSLGDFVISGGEIAALAVLDGLVRRLPGVMQDERSSVQESFLTGRLEHPHYTRPEIFEGQGVPELLLSGHHGKISDWRDQQSLCQTKRRRPDLLAEPEKKR
ncbi:MAG: tRNA (guanosine(37)-N1)-methyltransferase TrmD [Proteobacteria bacterium]|nr:tRNA (guanosine(37)-N1)-methyltransferase TrmD [Pseudomonadota bacterium]